MDAKEIPLSKGLTTLVDECDYDYLSQWKWHVWRSGGSFSVMRAETRGGVKSMFYMHREIMSRYLKKFTCVSHANGNKLDNRRSNLRSAGSAVVVRPKEINWFDPQLIIEQLKKQDLDRYQNILQLKSQRLKVALTVSEVLETAKTARNAPCDELSKHVSLLVLQIEEALRQLQPHLIKSEVGTVSPQKLLEENKKLRSL